MPACDLTNGLVYLSYREKISSILKATKIKCAELKFKQSKIPDLQYKVVIVYQHGTIILPHTGFNNNSLKCIT